MPENLDLSSLTTNTDSSLPVPDSGSEALGDTEPVVETPLVEDRQVPLSELLEERRTRQELQARVDQLSNAQIQLQQYLLAQQQAVKAQEGPLINPEIQEALAPYLASFDNRIAQAQQVAAQAQEALVFQSNLNYLKENLPNFEMVRLEIAKDIQKMPQAQQDYILSRPDAIVALGKIKTREMELAKASATRQVARASGRTEVGSSSVADSASQVNSETDWLNMSSEDFNKDPRVKAMFG